MKTIKAYKIDAYLNRIDTIEIRADDIHDMHKAIGCELFCVGKNLPNGDSLYVDDEGWMNGSVTRGFFFDGNFFAGNGLVLGLNRNSGASISVKTPELDLALKVKFPPPCFQISDEMREKAMSCWKITTW